MLGRLQIIQCSITVVSIRWLLERCKCANFVFEKQWRNQSYLSLSGFVLYFVVLHVPGVDMNFLSEVRTMHHRRNLTEIRKKSGLWNHLHDAVECKRSHGLLCTYISISNNSTTQSHSYSSNTKCLMWSNFRQSRLVKSKTSPGTPKKQLGRHSLLMLFDVHLLLLVSAPIPKIYPQDA